MLHKYITGFWGCVLSNWYVHVYVFCQFVLFVFVIDIRLKWCYCILVTLATLEFFRYSNVVLRFVLQKPILNSTVFLLVLLICRITLGGPRNDWVCFASQGNLTGGRNRWEGAYFRVSWNSCPFPLWVVGSDLVPCDKRRAFVWL